ncbi:MAG: nitroreductase family protein [Colwellia sp.]|nr:nitroreductase family protein [Colwellia sp.]
MKSMLRKLLSPAVLLSLKNTLKSLDELIFPYFSKSRFLSSFYYCFLSNQFRREHQAVLQGRLQYQSSLNDIKASSVLLRRNTHRLEKGLIMQPRRSVFAEVYINETVECFAKCLAGAEFCIEELKWAQDVLSQFFSVTGSTEVLDKARERFDALTLKCFEKNKASLPYQYQQRVTSTVTQQELHDLFKQRRSVRWYQEKNVENYMLEQAIDMASQAPSACNRQPFEFYTVTDMNKAAKVSSLAMGTAGFSDNIPAVIVVVGDLSAYPTERDRHIIYIDASLASMQLMLSLDTMGLSSCPLNWPDLDVPERKMSKLLNLPTYKRPIMLIAVGYAQSDGLIPYSSKKTSQTLRKEVNL